MNVPVHDFCLGGCELHMCFVDAVQTLFSASYHAVCNGAPSLNTVCMFVNYCINLQVIPEIAVDYVYIVRNIHNICSGSKTLG